MARRKERDRRKIDGAARAVAEVGARLSGVLIIEDDPNVQWQLARMLTVQGHRVVGTSSGDGAMALIAEWPVDLVLVDEDLPGSDGLEVARRLQRHYPEIPVVLMSGRSSPDLHVAARLAGVVACLTKPFRTEALHEVLASLDLVPAFAEPAE